jgi:hypothetical protein
VLTLKSALVVSAVAAATVAAAPLATAYEGPCETDVFGRCTYAPLAMATSGDSPANLAAYGETLDQNFAYFLTHDDDVPNFRITNFDLMKAQALQGCDLLRGGTLGAEVDEALQQSAGYSYELASLIVIAGSTVYCPDVPYVP